jgi:hypothetical protein
MGGFCHNRAPVGGRLDLVRRAAVAVVLMVVVGVAVGVALPRRWRVEKSVVIAGPPSRIHPYVSSLKRWSEWSPWTKERDAVARFSLSGPESGVGASRSWIGPVVGRGSIVIVEDDPKSGVTLEERLESETPNATGRLAYAREGSSTRVTWTDEGTLPSAAGGFYRGKVEQALGVDLERALSKLKVTVEALPMPVEAPPAVPDAGVPGEADGGAAPGTDAGSP